MKKLLLLLGLAAAWTACDNDDQPCQPNEPGDNAEITIRASIAGLLPDTKTSYTGSTAAWANGDTIGIFCTQSAPAAVNAKFKASGSGSGATWSASSAIYWGPSATQHTFLAYAPYVSTNTSAATVALPKLSVQNGTINPALDFLISNNLGSSGVLRSAGAVGLTFTHALSLIELDVTIGAGVAANTTLASFTIASSTSSDKIYTTDGTSTIALSTAAITLGSGVTNTATMTFGTPPVVSSTAVAAYALILPGTYTAPTLAITLNEAGTATVSVPATSLVTTQFDPGKKYTYAVNVARTAITISNPTITDWTNVNGGNVNPGL